MNPKNKREECVGNPSKLCKSDLNEESHNSTNLSMDSDSIPSDNGSNSENGGDLIYSDSVSDRKLFFETTDGDLWKNKCNIELLDPSASCRVWIGVTGNTHPIKHYITSKDINGKLSTIFLDHRSRHVVKTACVSFLRHGDPNQEWVREKISPGDKLHFSVDGDCLIISNLMNQLASVTLSKPAVIQFIDKDWVLHRFTKFLHNKLELIAYGENILTTNTSNHTSRDDFIERWLNPPNRTLSCEDIWTILRKKYC